MDFRAWVWSVKELLTPLMLESLPKGDSVLDQDSVALLKEDKSSEEHPVICSWNTAAWHAMDAETVLRARFTRYVLDDKAISRVKRLADITMAESRTLGVGRNGSHLQRSERALQHSRELRACRELGSWSSLSTNPAAQHLDASSKAHRRAAILSASLDVKQIRDLKAILFKHIKARELKLGIFFIDSVCEGEKLLEANMPLELHGPDYKDKDPESRHHQTHDEVEDLMTPRLPEKNQGGGTAMSLSILWPVKYERSPPASQLGQEASTVNSTWGPPGPSQDGSFVFNQIHDLKALCSLASPAVIALDATGSEQQ
ncbi:uncharacterized protein PAC_18898 [Phialocephala subalpina]|uniref:Uncharacterized protein n=1 Tax=Phialocephala subalpina TaxID=576137 RepID=A0A1L7XVG7_9HELO|nr:uncharacterized protein PAC_18898 [Phialocephala subalpina]